MLIINRFAYAPVGTFGRMEMPDGTVLYTVEDPWRDNEPNRSCIPAGQYECRPRRFNRGGYDSIHVTGVPDREYILFHKGNTEEDVQGCIAPGSALGFVHGKWAVSGSAAAFAKFMEHYGGTTFSLDIRSYDPETDAYGAQPAPSRSGRPPDAGAADELLRRHGVVIFEAEDDMPGDFVAVDR